MCPIEVASDGYINMIKDKFYACNLFSTQIQDDVLNSNVEPA